MRWGLSAIIIVSVAIIGSAGGCQAIKSGVTATYSADPPAILPVTAGTSPAAAPADLQIFLINGADPMRIAGMDKLLQRFQQSGYPNSRLNWWYEVGRVEREIRALHRADPTARFVLIGYSAGAYAAKGAATRLVRDGISVAMLGYIGGDYLRDTASTRVPGVGRIVNVTGDGYFLTGKNLFFNGTDIRGARNMRLAGTRHLALPNHPQTFAMLYEGVTEAAASGN